MRNPVLECIENRSSLRKFQSRPLEEKAVETILRAAMRAPSAANMQLYSILTVEDSQTKALLAKTCNNQPWLAHAPLILIFLADCQRMYDFYTFHNVEEKCRESGTVFIKPSEQHLLLASCDAMIAAQTAVIAAESLGIGSCYIGHIMDHFELHRDLFHLPPFAFPITMLALGYRPPEAFPKVTPRHSCEYMVFKESYRRLQKEELDTCYERYPVPPQGNRYKTDNPAQYFYLKRHASSSCYEEAVRSVKAALKNWTG